MLDVLILSLVGLLIGLAGGYIRSQKKKGAGCIGCPDSGSCGGHCAGCHHNCGKNQRGF